MRHRCGWMISLLHNHIVLGSIPLWGTRAHAFCSLRLTKTLWIDSVNRNWCVCVCFLQKPVWSLENITLLGSRWRFATGNACPTSHRFLHLKWMQKAYLAYPHHLCMQTTCQMIKNVKWDNLVTTQSIWLLML